MCPLFERPPDVSAVEKAFVAVAHRCLRNETSLEPLILSEIADNGADGDDQGIYYRSVTPLSVENVDCDVDLVVAAAALNISCWFAAAVVELAASRYDYCHLRCLTCSSPCRSLAS